VAEQAVAALGATDKAVGIGGAGLAAAAIELGLVDELSTFRNPIVVDGGTAFLPPVPKIYVRGTRQNHPSARVGIASGLLAPGTRAATADCRYRLDVEAARA
jgi:dihydrofolate reductase